MASTDRLEQFEDGLQRELGWRRKEMSSLLLTARAATGDAQSSAIRSGIVLIYAHLEGFVRRGAKEYFLLVKKEGLPYRELALNFIAFKLSRLVNQQSKKPSYYHDAAQLLVDRLDEAAELPKPQEITARSNLTYEQFEEILYCINIDTDSFNTKKNFMDIKLLEKRNAIAHGEYRVVDIAEYEDLHTGVVEIIDKFSELLVTAATARSFSVARTKAAPMVRKNRPQA